MRRGVCEAERAVKNEQDWPGPHERFDSDGLGLFLDLGSAKMRFTSAGAGDFSNAQSAGVLRLERSTGVPTQMWAQGNQVHGAELVTVNRTEDLELPWQDADGQLTNLPGVLCAVRTADCLPVLLASDCAVAALHGGWRGMEAGILAAGVEEATRLGQGALTAAIGPGARGCCYEVGDELIDRFAIYGSAAINGDHLDLATVARQQLVAAGVDQIIDCGICTI